MNKSNRFPTAQETMTVTPLPEVNDNAGTIMP